MKIQSPISNKFDEFLVELLNISNKPHSDITFQLFYDLFKLRSSQWKYKVLFKREVDFALSDILQDLLVHYLRILLPKSFTILCEHKKEKVRPDILIQKDDHNWAVIEVKTTIGWDRGLIKNGLYLERLHILSKTFDVPLNRTFYIFEAASNVNKHFFNIFKNNERSELRNFIYPLFLISAHPFWTSNIRDKKNKYEEFGDNEIYALYKKNVVTSLNHIVKEKIQN